MYQQPPNQPPNTYYPPQQPFQQPPMMPPQPPKKKSRVGLIVGVIAAVLLLSCIGVFALMNTASHTATTTIATTAANGTTPTAGSQSQGSKWTTTHTFTGNGTKKTAVFSAPNDWKIIYSCNGIVAGTSIDGILGVSVYGSDNTPIDPGAINATCKAGSKLSTGETEEHQAGQVYLSIDGTGDWKVTILELK